MGCREWRVFASAAASDFHGDEHNTLDKCKIRKSKRRKTPDRPIETFLSPFSPTLLLYCSGFTDVRLALM